MEMPVLLLEVHRGPLESYTHSTKSRTQFVARQNNGKAGVEVAKVRRVISASPPHGLPQSQQPRSVSQNVSTLVSRFGNKILSPQNFAACERTHFHILSLTTCMSSSQNFAEAHFNPANVRRCLNTRLPRERNGDRQ